MATDGYLFAPALPTDDRKHRILILIAVGFVAIALAAGTAIGMLSEMAVLAIGATGALAVWRWPTFSAGFMLAFTPVNRFVVFIFFSAVGSPTLLNGAQLWKDGIIAILLAKVIHEALVRKKAPTVYILDLFVIMFVAFHLFYILYPGTVPDNTFIGRVLGFRLDAYFLFAYFAGRGLTFKRDHIRWLLLGLIPGSVLLALVATWQWFFPGWANDLWNTLGYQAFVDAVGGSSGVAVRTRELAGVAIPRSSSLLLDDLVVAFYQLLLIPIAAALLLVQRRTPGWM